MYGFCPRFWEFLLFLHLGLRGSSELERFNTTCVQILRGEIGFKNGFQIGFKNGSTLGKMGSLVSLHMSKNKNGL